MTKNYVAKHFIIIIIISVYCMQKDFSSYVFDAVFQLFLILEYHSTNKILKNIDNKKQELVNLLVKLKVAHIINQELLLKMVMKKIGIVQL